MALIAFYLMAAVTLVSALMVIMARNPVHSVLWLILTFFSAAGLFVLIGAEFIAMLLVVVYVGAVAVLFLFVVMMLDVDFVELKDGTLRYWPFAMLVGIVFAAEIFMASVMGVHSRPDAFDAAPGADTNAEAIGQVMYTEYLLLFQLAGIVLLIAMIGAIVLTLRHRPEVKRQNIAKQTSRRRGDAYELKDPKPGQGI
ncbi:MULTISPECIES: NADH-quinone oxidoreductase subunit J [Hyphomonas]|uniref:NADH-quinone oxidoreductase subunit J n=2 Tax=Hyphomonas adhaerens TaxID=81029 RepID=A0A069E1P1_9PROT|nr:NADH-quinone oxidoreductase subunit J [Hyphomonas adhaerens]KCZ83360.1 NADH-quinone oxidoreductase subunit J [Hyphomonas adhaerens MHS-3]MBB38614.1 NADH:ubiquinone oxidoreductase subunit J [Hyphomonas sp.]HAE26458.1 NADH-quinone oxidoreductase subunit J [Hyphomonas adhaerens]